MSKSHLFVKKIRILPPEDVDKMLSQMKMPHHRTIFNILLYTGMRYIELLRLYDHREWVLEDRNVIHLPETAQLKKRRSLVERYIPIAPQIAGEIPYFFTNKRPPLLPTWNENLKRFAVLADIDDKGISAKVTRKTAEAWLYVAGVDRTDIGLRQGHTSLTALRHYAILPAAFTSGEQTEIKERFAGIKLTL